MKALLVKYSITSLLAFVLIFNAHAAIEKVVSPTLKTADLVASTVFTVQDGKYSTMLSGMPVASPGRQFTGFYNKKVTNRVIFNINQYSKSAQPQAYCVTLLVRIVTQVYNGASSSYTTKTQDKYFTINYDPGNIYNDRSVYEFDDATAPTQLAGYSMQMTILSVTGLTTTAANLELHAEIETERYYTFVPAMTSSSQNSIDITGINTQINTTDGVARVSWAYRDWAEQYDLEWFHVTTLGMSSTTPSDVYYDENSFRYNATRVTVTNNTFDIPLIYNQGYIVYRIRGYGKVSEDNFTTLVPGFWTTDGICPCTSLASLGTNTNNRWYIFIDATNAHEEKLNWQYSIGFAEQGKNKVSVNYFDGTLRNRQTVSKSKVFNLALVSEKIYDYEGRPAIEVLPVPSSETTISYKRLFNQSNTTVGKAYSRLDFDLDISGCQTGTGRMNNSTGSARYYSSTNTLSSTLSGNNAYLKQFEKYIPNAMGFPFQQTIYTPDNTNRVKEKTGSGADFQLGGNKTTKYFYGKPFQEELDRLFGYEVGNALFYNKTMTVDPNGQISISYLNPAGKVIATNLTGNSPKFMDSVRTTPMATSPDFRVDLLNKSSFQANERGSENILDLNSKSLLLNKTLLVDKDQPYYFAYENRGQRVQMQCLTSGINFCYDCVYDLKITLTDECGNEYLTGIDATVPTADSMVIGQSILTDVTGTTPTYNSTTRCALTDTPDVRRNYQPDNTVGTGWYTSSAGSMVSLPVGNYFLKKKLTLNEKVLDFYTKDYLTNNTCLHDINYFKAQFSYLNDIYNCEMTCEQCTTRVGSFADYHGSTIKPGYPELTEDQYNALIDRCLDRCKVKSYKCQAAYEGMLADVSPNGQYGELREHGFMDGGVITDNPLTSDDEIKPYLHPLSIFNEGNYLPVKSTYNGRKPNWRYPYDESGNPHYYDEKGNVCYVTLVLDESNHLVPGVTADALNNGLVIYSDEDGSYKVEPQYLLDIKDFIHSFKPSWAKSLVMYHPEYQLYVLCGNMSASNDFDEQWAVINDAQVAKTTFDNSSTSYDFDYLNPLGSTMAEATDPYFNSSNTYMTLAEYNKMKDQMVNFAKDNLGGTMSIWDLAMKIAMCPNSTVNCNNTCSFPFDPSSPTDLPGWGTPDADKVWIAFRGLYMSLKQRMQQTDIAHISMEDPYTCYNGCIGNTEFNPTKYGFEKTPFCITNYSDLTWATGAPWNFVYYWSQYYNFSQPCNWARAYLYRDKTPRFEGVTDILKLSSYNTGLTYDPDEEKMYVLESYNETQNIISQTRQAADVGIFSQCQKCPLAHKLEQMLNKLSSTNLTNTTQLTCNSSGDDNFNIIDENLYTLLNGAPPSGSPLYWSVGSILTSELIVNVGSSACTIRLSQPTGAAFDFSKVIGLYNLKYKYNPLTPGYGTAENNTFEILAYVNDLKPTDPSFDPLKTTYVMLEGKISCLDIANCSFAPVCEPTQAAKDLMSLFNVLTLVPDNTTCPAIPFPLPTPAFVSSTPVAIATTEPYKAGMSSYLKYEIDRDISPSYVNLAEQWVWSTVITSTTKMTATIASAIGAPNMGKCDINFDLGPAGGFAFADIKKFVSIAPDPNNQPYGFTAVVFVKNVSFIGYKTITGSSPCFAFGTCSNDPVSAYNPLTYLPKEFACQDYDKDIEDDILQLINCGEGSLFKSTWPDGTHPAAAGSQCKCHKASTGEEFLLDTMRASIQSRIDQLMLGNACKSCNPCKRDTFRVRLYDKDYKDKFGVPQPGATFSSYFVDWDCFNDDSITPSGRFITRVPDFMDLLIISQCSVIAGVCQRTCFPTVVIDPTDKGCILKYVSSCPVCGEGSGITQSQIICVCYKGNSGWGGDDGEGGGCGDPPCPIQIELPAVPGFDINDIASFVSIQPDPERPVPTGYFKAVIVTVDGLYMNIKGFMPCLPKGICGECEAAELVEKGDFPSSIANGDFITNYTYNSDGLNLNGGEYGFLTSTSGASLLGNYSNNTIGSSGSKFLLIRSAAADSSLKKIWEDTLTVIPNTQYQFSFYYLNPLLNPNPAGINNGVLVKVNGREVAVRDVNYESTATWHKYTYTFNTRDSDTVVVQLFDIERYTDNFIAIDDISLRPVCGCRDLSLLTNGDFNSGYFPAPQSDFARAAGSPIGTNQYEIVNSFCIGSPACTPIKDELMNNTGSIMHLKFAASATGKSIWRQTVDVIPGKEYAFSVWWQTNVSNSLNISLVVNGQVIQKVNNSTNIFKWFILQGRWKNLNAPHVLVEVVCDNLLASPLEVALDEVKFTELCNPGVCPTPILFKPHIRDCETYINGLIDYSAGQALKAYIEEEKGKFRENLISKCLNVYEGFEMNFIQSEQFYTLYYYDQGGNLVRTVPPAGVNRLTNTSPFYDLDQIKIDRKNAQRNLFTSHTYASTYKFNSLNQVMEQSSPDQDNFNISDFYSSFSFNSGGLQKVNSTTYFGTDDGIAVGYDGSNGVIYTGTNLTQNASPLEMGDITSVIVVGNGTTVDMIYAVSAQKQLLYSDNKGATWYTKRTPSIVGLIQVYYNGTRVFIFNSNGEAWSSADKGDTWQAEASVCTTCSLQEVKYADANNAIAITTTGDRYYLVQGQTTWNKSTALVLPDLTVVTEMPSTGVDKVLIAAGDNGTLLKTLDYGLHWSKIAGSSTFDFSQILFIDGTKAIAISAGLIYYTLDAGITWSAGVTLTGELAVDMATYNGDVYITTNKGKVIKYVSTGSSVSGSTLYTSVGSTTSMTSISVSSNVIYLTGNTSQQIFKLKYNGSTWDPPVTLTLGSTTTPNVPYYSSTNVRDIYFVGGADGVIITDDGYLYRVSVDNITSTYTLMSNMSGLSLPTSPYIGLYFMSVFKGYAWSADGKIVLIDLTASSPAAWSQHSMTGGSSINTFWAENDNLTTRAIAVGQSGKIYTTNDENAWVDRSYKVTIGGLNGMDYLLSSGSVYTAVIVGNNGTVLKSTDKGITWTFQPADTKADINDAMLVFDNPTVKGYAVTNSSFIRCDLGANWTVATSNPLPGSFTSFGDIALKEYTVSSKKAVVTGVNTSNNKQVYEIDLAATSPGAATQLTGVGIPSVVGSYNALSVYKGTSEFWVCAVGNKAASPVTDQDGCNNDNLSIYIYSTVSGNTRFATTCKFAEVNDVARLGNTLSMVAVGAGGLILKTTDKGQTWQRKDGNLPISPPVNDLRAVHFYDPLNGVAVGTNGVITITKDGGETWKFINKPSIGNLNDVMLIDNTFGVIVGDNKTVFLLNGGDFGNEPNWVNKSADINSLLGSGVNLVSAAFVSKRNGFVLTSAAAQGLLFNITSTPNPWSVATVTGLTLNNGAAVIMQDLKKGFIITKDKNLIKTINGGSTWAVSSALPGTGTPIHISTPDNRSFYITYQNAGPPITSTITRYTNIDHYSSRFYYDKLGRIVLSRNAKQFNKSTASNYFYSYVFYDYKGRAIEAGEIVLPSLLEDAVYSSQKIYNYGIVDYTLFATWVGTLAANKRTEVTKTYYDVKNANFTQLPSGFVMKNLRNRVAHITFAAVNNADESVYDFGTHSTYDAHGNVTSILHENNMIPVSITSDYTVFKRVDYDYDLISGKVNKVTYQAPLNAGDPPNPDRFFHKYEYDAENRLTNVYTSNDGLIWQQDAKYFYYMHGPLARTEIGNDQVQGIDYAYTIQGWVKGVNSATMTPSRDIGKDGNTGDDLNSNFAYDEFGYTLGYFKGDYTAIGMSTGALTATNHFEAQWASGNPFYNGSIDLGNGNISNMVTAVRKFMTSGASPQAMAYKYDQLNRLKSTQAYVGNTDVVTNNRWNTGAAVNQYKESFSYDDNGNIKTLTRADGAGANLDNLTYRYANITNGYTKNSNRLKAVSDAITTAGIPDDIESGQAYGAGANPSIDNYQYDELGNLTRDSQERIRTIEWTLNGKIKKITRTASSGLPDLEFVYDPAGNRVMKIVKPSATQSTWIYTIYARDAHGNILSTYNLVNTGTSAVDYEQDEATIYGSSRLGDFVPNRYENCGIYVLPSMPGDSVTIVNWIRNYLMLTIGFTPTAADQIINAWRPILNTRGFNFTLTTANPLWRKAFLEEFAKLFCLLRCYKFPPSLAGSVLTNISIMLTQYTNEVRSLAGSPSVYTPSRWVTIDQDMMSYMNATGFGLFAGLPQDCGNTYTKGARRYELSNRSGNVMAVVSDRKVATGTVSGLKLEESHFSYDVNGWGNRNGGGASWDISGALQVTAINADDGTQKTISANYSKSYTLTFNLTLAAPTATVKAEITDGASSIRGTAIYSTPGAKSISFTTTATNRDLAIKFVKMTPTGSSSKFFIDDVILTEVSTTATDHYEANVIQAYDYYAFGSAQYNRIYYNTPDTLLGKYNFGYQGSEKDDEVKGTGNSYTTEFRQYDPRIGRWMSLDPLSTDFPWQSPYVAFDNNPIMMVDPTGQSGGDPQKYKVEKGNTLSGIAKAKNTTVDDIMKLNPDIKDKDKIYEGQEINVPSSNSNQSPIPAASNANKQAPSAQTARPGSTASNPQQQAPSGTLDGGEHFIGPGLYLLGQPLKVLKPVGALGSKPGSSIASYTLSKTFPQTFTRTLGRKAGTTIATKIGTNVIGRALGRYVVPGLGLVLTCYDVSSVWFPAAKEAMKSYNEQYPIEKPGNLIYHVR